VRGKTKTDVNEAPGYDAFLDIATNIVGILIILVMVVGVQAKDAWIAAADHLVADTPEEEIDGENPHAEAAGLEAEIGDLIQKSISVKREVDARFQVRHQLQLMATAAKQELEARRSELDEMSRKEYDLQHELTVARSELEDLKHQQYALDQSRGYVDILENVPTPLAKTVFGKEEHFRLLNGRLTYVPVNEFVSRLRDELEQKAWRLKKVPQITETIGPIDGFRMKYTLERKRITVDTPAGPMVRDVVGLERFVLVPVSERLGEPFEQALQPQSNFRTMLQAFHPETTTITVWCYPDSFDQFRELKRQLLQLGFRSAGRPMPPGHPISGSPHGTRSATE
jgi:hypothetical protein